MWCLCVLLAFTRVSLYQSHHGLMQHDRTSFHPRVWAAALKCYNASHGRGFVAPAGVGGGDYKWQM